MGASASLLEKATPEQQAEINAEVEKLKGEGVSEEEIETQMKEKYSSLLTAAATSEKYEVVFVLGGPGSGKGTQCSKIVEVFGYIHLSAGDLLREERQSGSELAEMINTNIKEGKIVPAEVTVGLLRTAMEKSGATKFLIDGFPRDADNLSCWQEQMAEVATDKFLLFLECPEDIMVARLLERGKTSGRNDDNEESIRKRLVTYEESTRPVIEVFKAQDKVRSVDSNRELEEVFKDVSVHFAPVAAVTSE